MILILTLLNSFSPSASNIGNTIILGNEVKIDPMICWYGSVEATLTYLHFILRSSLEFCKLMLTFCTTPVLSCQMHVYELLLFPFIHGDAYWLIGSTGK